MRRKFTCYRCGKYVEAEMDTDGDATCPACENVIGLEPERKLQNRIASLELQLAEAKARLAWIPVGERLPEEKQRILSTDGKEFYLDYYARWEGKDNPPCFCYGLSWAVTHWMPLPQMPEVQE